MLRLILGFLSVSERPLDFDRQVFNISTERLVSTIQHIRSQFVATVRPQLILLDCQTFFVVIFQNFIFRIWHAKKPLKFTLKDDVKWQRLLKLNWWLLPQMLCVTIVMVNGALNVIRSITLQFPHSSMMICYMRISQGIRHQQLQLKLKWWTLKLDQSRKSATSECL